MRDRGFWICTLAAAAAGVALRVVYVLAFVRGDIALTGDARTYHLLGRFLADGEGYIRPVEFEADGVAVPTAEFPPLYPMFLGALDLVGIGGADAQRLVGAVLGAATIVVIALLGAAVAGRIVGMVAAWSAAIYPQLVMFDGSLMSEGPMALLVATALLAVVRARSAESDRLRWRWWALASVAVGLAVLTRSEAILFVPLLLIPATRVPGDGRAWARAAAVACAGTIVMTGAWTIRNAISLDHVQPMTNNSGTALAGANCDRVYSGVQIGGWRLDCVPGDLSGDETERAAEARRIGIEYMRDHAAEVPSVVAARLGRTFGVWDVRSNLFFESLESRDYHWLWAGWYAWLVLAPLALLGGIARRRAGGELWPLLVPLVIVVAVSAATYGNQRFRVAAEPSIVVLAALGAVAAARRVTGHGPTTGAATDDGSSSSGAQAEQTPAGS